jgi:hypothetical protein
VRLAGARWRVVRLGLSFLKLITLLAQTRIFSFSDAGQIPGANTLTSQPGCLPKYARVPSNPAPVPLPAVVVDPKVSSDLSLQKLGVGGVGRWYLPAKAEVSWTCQEVFDKRVYLSFD